MSEYQVKIVEGVSITIVAPNEIEAELIRTVQKEKDEIMDISEKILVLTQNNVSLLGRLDEELDNVNDFVERNHHIKELSSTLTNLVLKHSSNLRKLGDNNNIPDNVKNAARRLTTRRGFQFIVVVG